MHTKRLASDKKGRKDQSRARRAHLYIEHGPMFVNPAVILSIDNADNPWMRRARPKTQGFFSIILAQERRSGCSGPPWCGCAHGPAQFFQSLLFTFLRLRLQTVAH